MRKMLLASSVFIALVLVYSTGWAQQPQGGQPQGEQPHVKPKFIGTPPPRPAQGNTAGQTQAPRPANTINTHGVTQVWTDVAYASGSPAQKMDIYLPNEGKGPFPVILAIHGGGFEGGDKNSGEVNAELNGLTRGYAVVCVNYRLAGEAIFPAAILDLKAAIRFLRANAAKYNLNPNKIAAWGDSAGANMASEIGTSAGVKELEDLSMGNAKQPSNVQVVVDWFGPTDFARMNELFVKAGATYYMDHDDKDSSESHYLGAQVGTVPAKVKLADPTTFISSKTPPFFIENGSEDPTVPPQQNTDLAAALEKAIGKDKVVHIVLQGSGHGGAAFSTPENLDKVFAFLDKYMK